jgi:hypothetical protein
MRLTLPASGLTIVPVRSGIIKGKKWGGGRRERRIRRRR